MTELNKSSKTFSQRELAKYLKWPVSYIPDVIRERKPFTVARSLEFIRAFKVSSVDAEHLIFIAIASQSKTDLPDLRELRKLKSPKMREGIFPDLKVYNFSAVLTCEAISLLSPNATRAKVERLLKSRGLNSETVDLNLRYLLEKELIVLDGESFKCTFSKSYSTLNLNDSDAREMQQAFLESAKTFFNDFYLPATGSSSFVMINRGRFEEVREKVLMLKNWILEVSAVDAKSPSGEANLFQFEQHLIPVFRPEILQDISSRKS